MSEFERIISDSMLACEAYNQTPYDEGLELEEVYADLEEDADWDVYGEEEFA
jgi:hypothetical protein